MDLSIHSLRDLILVAFKSEIAAKDFYLGVSERVKNALLKDRLKFLSDEEEKHRAVFERLFRKKFPNEEAVPPEVSPIALPDLRIDDECMPISDVMSKGMDAEKAAYDFYTQLADRFEDDLEVKNTLSYIASMEMGHYRLLEVERENARKFEDTDFEWPMMHVGP
jgi:rubrerythrin